MVCKGFAQTYGRTLAVMEIIKLIRERKWDMIIILFLLVAASIMLPFYISGTINSTIGKSIEPVVLATESVQESVDSMMQLQIDDTMDRAIAAYNKIKTVDDLNPLNQNGVSIKRGLAIAEVRNALFVLDPVRTKQFEEYFLGN